MKTRMAPAAGNSFVIAVWTVPIGQGDAIFNANAPVNRDDSCSGFRLLKAGVEARGGRVHTQDVLLAEGVVPDLVITLDVPGRASGKIPAAWAKVPRWLIIQECQQLVPRNWRDHTPYERIFTWDDSYVDNRRYCKLNLPNPLPTTVRYPDVQRPRFATLITSNLKASHPQELYSQRRAVIEWYERYEPDKFEFYGRGWDLYRFGGPKLVRGLNLITPLRRAMPTPRHPSYRGAVDSKWETYAKYRFAYCYENVQGATGYITEKIFDAFISGSIPVYWGAPNVADHIPEAAFVDRRAFSTQAQLHAHLVSLDTSQRQAMLDAAQAFLAGSASDPYRDQTYANTLLSGIDAWREQQPAVAAPPAKSPAAPSQQ